MLERESADGRAAAGYRGAMRCVYYTATTLDGFVADPSHSLDWLFAVPAGEDRFTAFLEQVGALVMGASTFAWVYAHERLREHPESWRGFYGDRPTFVFANRSLPRVPGADLRFVAGDVASHWEAIREAAGGRWIWVVGGGDLAGQVYDAGLLDEIQLSIAPAALGSGAPLFPRRVGASALELVSVRQNRQFAELVYHVRRHGPRGDVGG